MGSRGSYNESMENMPVFLHDFTAQCSDVSHSHQGNIRAAHGGERVARTLHSCRPIPTNSHGPDSVSVEKTAGLRIEGSRCPLMWLEDFAELHFLSLVITNCTSFIKEISSSKAL